MGCAAGAQPRDGGRRPGRPPGLLIHDRDTKFSAAFDEVFRTEGSKVIRTPVRAPNANAHAERFVRTLREECLDWLLVVGRRQLQRVVREYVDHYTASARIGRSGYERPIPHRR
jgi:putative transposase